MPLPKINLRYIRRVLRFIEGGPKLRFDMSTYGDHAANEFPGEELNKTELRKLGYPECGTRACFAGWCVLLQHKKKDWSEIVEGVNISDTAQKLCGFTDDEADTVFDGVYGPFSSQLKSLKSRLNDVLANRGSKARI